MRKNSYALAFMVFIMLATGVTCNTFGSTLPDPTTRTMSIADVAGVYTYEFDGNTVTLHLNADGTFEILNSPGLSGSGRWYLDGSEITFEYPDSPPNVRSSVSGWYVYENNGALAIMGGEGDPDDWQGLSRVP